MPLDPVRLLLSRAALVLALVAIPLAYLVHGALVRPEVEFLSASGGGDWALYPGQPVRARKPVSRDVTFRRVFELDAVPEHLALRVRAFTEMSVSLNGRTLDVAAPASWKRAAVVDLGPRLRIGRNVLAVRVHNPGSLPALCVDAPAGLATRAGWDARLEGDARSGFVNVAAPLARALAPGPLQRAAAWPVLRVVALLWLALVAGIGLAVAWRELRARSRPPGDAAPRTREVWTPPAWLRVAVPAAILAAAGGLHLYNAALYPPNELGFDFWGHLHHLLIVVQERRSPLPSEGWQTYHPPLYYAFAALVYSIAGPIGGIRAVQIAGATVALGLPLLAFATARRIASRDVPGQWVALAFAAFLPVTFTMSPQLNNEAFAATVIAAGIYFACVLVERPQIPPWLAALAGAVAGAGLLSKFSGLFGAGAAVAALALRAVATRARRDALAVAAFALGTAVVCGWFYVRNVLLYGHPFVGNWEYDPDGPRTFEQLPAFRTAAFYARFGALFFAHPTESVFASFLDGNYGTFWADGQRAFFRDPGDPAFGWMSAAMLVAALPTLAIAIGFAETLGAAVRRPAASRDVVLAAAGCWTFAALVLYTMQIPIHSAVKASFFLFLVPTLAACLTRGRARLARHLPWSRALLDTSVAAVAGLTAFIYRLHP